MQITLSEAAQHRLPESSVSETTLNAEVDDPKIQLLLTLLEKMTGQKLKLFNVGDLQQSSFAQVSTSHAISTSNHSESPQSERVGYSIDYTKEVSYHEVEQTVFQSNGVIKTADGKEIAFDLTLSMQREYYQSNVTHLHWGDPIVTDPLIINFNGTAAQLSDQTFAFDLNSDGLTERVNAPVSGSGFLVFDKNVDGTINNGSELFGPNTGNGFSELAQLDENHDAWLDENDAKFQQLKVWTDTTDGNGKLSSLSALGIGAIYLKATSTPFAIKDSSNQTLGLVRASSVWVSEEGSVNTIQQIDLSV
ncbi:hypothetical protein [Methylocucumis oryzae]|uniref:hypothetical protein n=1 Tax=Methylocucumis oryzae TaxID=1632867 RepID=UPI0006960D1D|nr:hypothetical protein [Methylocucumis oryzae]